MIRVISAPDAYSMVIALKANSIFYSGGVVPDVGEGLVRMDALITEEKRIVAKKDLIIVVDGLWRDPCTGANNVLFIREDRADENAKSLLFARPCVRPNLRQALIDLNVPAIESVGGFDRALVYGDEIAVIETYGGSYGWIIKRDDVQTYLNAAKTLRDEQPRRPRRLRVWHEFHVGKDCEIVPSVRVEGWGQQPAEQDVTLCGVSTYDIFYDPETRVIRSILLTNDDVRSLPTDRAPLRCIALGGQVPECLTRNR